MITGKLRVLLGYDLMAVKVDFDDKAGYVLVNIKGTSNKSDLLAAFEKIFLYSSLKNANRMLVDCRGIESVMPMKDISLISEKFNNIQSDYEGMMNNQITFAFLISNELHDPKKINEALHEGEEDTSYIGSDVKEAEKWLLTK